jgi:hypothetical protein
MTVVVRQLERVTLRWFEVCESAAQSSGVQSSGVLRSMGRGSRRDLRVVGPSSGDGVPARRASETVLHVAPEILHAHSVRRGDHPGERRAPTGVETGRRMPDLEKDSHGEHLCLLNVTQDPHHKAKDVRCHVLIQPSERPGITLTRSEQPPLPLL